MTALANSLALSVATRAYAEAAPLKKITERRNAQPSDITLIFDTETRTDAGQALRFGAFQIRRGLDLVEEGLFYRSEVLTSDEISLLKAFAERRGVNAITQSQFVEAKLHRIGLGHRATIVGFNLPFDIARIAIRHGRARRDMRDGFCFTLTKNKRRPTIRTKHVSRTVNFLKFGAPYEGKTGRSDRSRGWKRRHRSGFFVDVNTLASALLSRSFSLAKLADHLETGTRKAGTEEHGGTLTEEYISYALQDVQVTWECFTALRDRYGHLKLPTPLHQIYSEASLGKGYLKALGVKPWREVQPDVPPELIGIIMSTFLGGRSEVRIRRERRQVALTDFLSMYPTVCTLMNLWQFVIASGMDTMDNTEETRSRLDSVTVPDLQRPETWRDLTTLVQIKPCGDVLPVRAEYDGKVRTIGLNALTSDPIWYTLADCVAAKILTGRSPEVIQSLRFSPRAPQTGLNAARINGNAAYVVDPRTDDLYRRLIELRHDVKERRDRAGPRDRDRLDADQNAIKIAANATSFGIFAEVNVTDASRPRTQRVHSGGHVFEFKTDRIEEPGRFFHPLVASLITGAARLMLAITEHLVTESGLEWLFCDTDSMAIARPADLAEVAFHERVDKVVAWFTALNPYAFGGPLLKVEDVNFGLCDPGDRTPLFGYAVSAKRYALFNVDADGKPIIRKASAHGLGHLRAPYDESSSAPGIPKPLARLDKIGVALWQHDIWWRIAHASGNGPVGRLPLDHHSALLGPSVSRYHATTPAILRWFDAYNKGRSYDDQVRPSGFLNAFTSSDRRLSPVAPFDRDIARSAANAFDRNTGVGVPASALQTYAEALADYHLHSEAKFENGTRFDHGTTRRRHVIATGSAYIGKEANRWEQQFYLGADPEADVEYGRGDARHLFGELRRLEADLGQRGLADELGIARETLRTILSGRRRTISGRLTSTIERKLVSLSGRRARAEKHRVSALDWVKSEVSAIGLTMFSRREGLDPSNVSKILLGKRRLPEEVVNLFRRRHGR